VKKIAILSAVMVFIMIGGASFSSADDKPKLYTAYNMWKSRQMKCINFKQGDDIMPAGTEVRSVRITQQGGYRSGVISFTTVDDGKSYTVGFTSRWHPKKTADDYRKMMFSPKTFEELTDGLSDVEIDAIRKGILVKGMSKKAVFICYGPPPEHHTRSLDANTWYYWNNRRDRFAVRFGHDQKLVLDE
jgi:hypothetical protein